MMILAFGNVSNKTSQENLTCIYKRFNDPFVFSGIILILIGLVLGLIIIIIRKQHSSTIISSIFIVITMISMDVGVALLISLEIWYEEIISVLVATVFCALAIFINVKLQVLQRKWKILSFTMCCVFAIAEFVLFVIGVRLKMNVLIGAAWICWCFIMFIVIISTIAYLKACREQEQFSTFYSFFLLIYEHIILVISLLFTLNTFIDCHSISGNLNMTMIGHD
ncbi:unnamed protein product [Schistosoma rodhaini]|uniref:Uncharacterized protein n=1 Tax=Schistosoma rodhaini TaxID=6188 RepID=A0AA85GBK8_9TREM|nr:unnamed protein product [Schistosoma rodhaini]